MATKITWAGAGSTVTVSSIGALNAAIVAAAAGDTIQLADGTYSPANYVPNPSFETNTTSWVTTIANLLNSGATLTRDLTQFQVGIASGKVVTPGAAVLEGAAVNVPGTFLQGRQYTARIAVKGNAGGESLRIYFGDAPTPDVAQADFTGTTSWQIITLSWTPSANRTGVAISIPHLPATAATYFLDGAMVVEGPAPAAYFDGSVNGAWLGTAHASQSVPTITSTINKAIRVKAQNPQGAILTGGNQPVTTGVDPGHSVYGIQVRSDGVYVEDLSFKFFGVAVDLDQASNCVIQGNRIESMYDAGIQVFGCGSPQVHMNEFRDPYLLNDTPSSMTAAGSIVDAQSDYGVDFWGCTSPRVTHNYFFGVFNQACSFKEGNQDAYAGYNTFEGFALSALLFGQNKPSNGPYPHTGLPLGPDIGTMVAEYNVFRPIQGPQTGVGPLKTYFANLAIRVWHTNGNVTLRGNIIEASRSGILIEGREGASVGYATGTVTLDSNIIGGTWNSIVGTPTLITTSGAVRLYKGIPAVVTMTNNKYVLCSPNPTFAPDFDDGGLGGVPSYSESGTKTVGFDFSTGLVGGSAVNLTLKTATTVFDPDLTFTGVRSSPVYVKAISPINENVGTVQTMFTDIRTNVNGLLTGGSLAPRSLTSRELAANAVGAQELHWLLARRLGIQKPGGGYSTRRNTTQLVTQAVAANPTTTTLITHTYTSESARDVIYVCAEIGQPTVAQVYNVNLTLDGVNLVPTDTNSLSGASYRVTRQAGWTDVAAGEGKQMFVVPLTQQYHSYLLKITVQPAGGAANMGFVRLFSMMIDMEF